MSTPHPLLMNPPLGLIGVRMTPGDSNIIQVVRAIRNVLGCSLVDAKDMAMAGVLKYEPGMFPGGKMPTLEQVRPLLFELRQVGVSIRYESGKPWDPNEATGEPEKELTVSEALERLVELIDEICPSDLTLETTRQVQAMERLVLRIQGQIG